MKERLSATQLLKSAVVVAYLICCAQTYEGLDDDVMGQKKIAELSASDLSVQRCKEGTCKKKEFYLAACTIFRDEDQFLREWLSFHVCTGIEHFFLYVDRPSTSCFNDILRPFIDSGLVTLQAAHPPPNPQVWPNRCSDNYYCCNCHLKKCMSILQIPTYDQCVRDHGGRAQWMAFFDVDEFLFPANRSNVLSDILRKYVNSLTGHQSCMVSNSPPDMCGSEPTLVLVQFRRCRRRCRALDSLRVLAPCRVSPRVGDR